jgi:hypothetical protein
VGRTSGSPHVRTPGSVRRFPHAVGVRTPFVQTVVIVLGAFAWFALSYAAVWYGVPLVS